MKLLFVIKTTNKKQGGSVFAPLIIRDSLIDWNDSVTIRLNEIELISDKDQQIKFTGFINFEFKDLTKFYSYYQISRNFRSNIKNIQLDFIYELNNKKIVLDNIRIDNEGNEEVNQLINEFNGQNKNIFNKVTFRNFIKDFFIIYEG